MAILINSPKGKGFAACEAGKPQTSNPYPAFDGGCSWDEWMDGWQQAFDMARFGINESRPRHQGEHMTDKQPDALRLADWLEADSCDLQPPMDAAAELRRLHAENERLKAEQGELLGLLKEARKIIRASASRNLAKDWDQRTTEVIAKVKGQ